MGNIRSLIRPGSTGMTRHTPILSTSHIASDTSSRSKASYEGFVLPGCSGLVKQPAVQTMLRGGIFKKNAGNVKYSPLTQSVAGQADSEGNKIPIVHQVHMVLSAIVRSQSNPFTCILDRKTLLLYLLSYDDTSYY